jgi:acetate kinase
LTASLARVLTINAGSSSVKIALFAVGPDEAPLASAAGERTADHAAALRAALARIQAAIDIAPLSAVVHRIVHGGARYRDPVRITSDVRRDLSALISLDPDHMPQALAAIQTTAERYPAVPQIACFDTAFHQSLPRVAQMYALPRRFWDAGVRRYGFHGLSCESIMRTLVDLDPAAASGRVIIAHLGSGASLTAVQNGRSVETTMGFSPAGGVMMGTRPGDLDPGVLLYAARNGEVTADALSCLVNHDAGLLGVSETSQDMRDLLACESADPRAADAIALFCYSIRKAIGSLAAVLGGLDTLVFTAGIGERAAAVRQRICKGLRSFGIDVDDARNASDAAIISAAGSVVTIRVIATDEDRMLARHAADILAAGERDV